MSREEKIEYCKECKFAIWDSCDGYSPKECGMSRGSISFVDGCKKSMSPELNDDDELDCEDYEKI